LVDWLIGSLVGWLIGAYSDGGFLPIAQMFAGLRFYNGILFIYVQII